MSELPSGTVTFLFTDIEGSTRRWEGDPAAMRAALARHDSLLRQAIEARGGRVFKTVGDAFCAAFTAAPAAVTAALDAQRALGAERWETLDAPLRVRMALLTGSVEETHGDYAGPPLNRVARLLAAGHGGQVLISLATEELARDALPVGTTLRDLGEHRLKDLQRPERVFQVVTADLPADFPTLRTLDARRHNLPIQPTALIGREAEIAQLADLLGRDGVRLCTLTGPGGTGKTRLGLHVAAELVDQFADGVFFVPLAPLSDPELVLSTISQILGAQESGGGAPREILTAYLRQKRLLLLLDNFEHLLGAAPLLAELLASAPELRILVTSRAPLRLRGERLFPVEPLALPDPRSLPSLAQLTQYEAVRLFIDRALDVAPAFRVTNRNAPAVAAICARLDGLPLAIELAAARVNILPPEAMLARLEHRLQLLTAGARDLPLRQRTLRSAIAWSHDLLQPTAQAIFRRLAIFAGGFTLEAAEAVCRSTPGAPERAPGDPQPDILQGLTELVEGSLLRQEARDQPEARFDMLETVREFALERLGESGEAETARRLHSDYYLELAERAAPALRGIEQIAWVDRLEREHDNFRLALAWHLAAPGQAEGALRLAAALGPFWWIHTHLTEGTRWLEQALATAGDMGLAPVRVKALYHASTLAFFQGDVEDASRWAEEGLSLARLGGDPSAIARSIVALERVAAIRGEVQRSAALIEEGLAMAYAAGDRWAQATLLNNLAETERSRGEHEGARAHYEAAARINREIGNWVALMINFLNLGSLALAQDELTATVLHYQQALEIAQRLGKLSAVAAVLEGMASIHGGRGQPERAARLMGAATALRETLSHPRQWADREPYERSVAAVRATLGEESFARHWAEGRTLTHEQALAEALEGAESSPDPSEEAGLAGSL